MTSLIRLFRATSLSLALAIPAASLALSASTPTDAMPSAPEQMAKAPAPRAVVAPGSTLRNGAGLIIDPVYGIPVPGQSFGGY